MTQCMVFVIGWLVIRECSATWRGEGLGKKEWTASIYHYQNVPDRNVPPCPQSKDAEVVWRLEVRLFDSHASSVQAALTPQLWSPSSSRGIITHLSAGS